MRASPESLSRMRRYFTPGARGSFGGSRNPPSPPPSPLASLAGAPFLAPFLRGARPAPVAFRFAMAPAPSGLSDLLLHFFDEVVGALLETLADLVTDEAPDAHVLARLGDEIGLERADVL